MAEGVRRRHLRTCKGGKCRCPWIAEARRYRGGPKIRKHFGTEAAAKNWRRDMLSAAQMGKLRSENRQTVAQALDDLLENMEAGTVPSRSQRQFKPSTIRGYRRAIEKRITPALGHIQLRDVTRPDVQRFAQDLKCQGCSASTIRNSLDPLRVVFREAVSNDQVPGNPTANLRLFKTDPVPERIAAPEEVRLLLDALPSSERPLWTCAFLTGMRRGELRGLQWSDVDLDAGVIRIRRSWDDEDGEILPKTIAGTREVPIVDELDAALRGHQRQTGRIAGLVFGRTSTEPFIASTVRARARRAWKIGIAHLAPITLRGCRHTFDTLLLQGIGVELGPKDVQGAMGHSSAKMTLDVYAHRIDGSTERVRAAMSRALAPQR